MENLIEKRFNPIQRNQRFFETVFHEIKRLIVRGIFKPGDKLPSEGALAKQFNVGRQTIREAMRLLELSGFVELKKGGTGGPVVKNGVLSAVNRLLLDVFQIEKITIEEIVLARLEIERGVVSYAVNYADEKDVAALRKNIARATQKISENKVATVENIEFHNLLARATKNQVYAILVGTLMAVLEDYHNRIPSDVAVSAKAVQSHKQIVDALVKRDRKQADRILVAHLKEVKSQLQGFSHILECS